MKMTFKWGRCINNATCKEAKRGHHVPVSASKAFICPECLEPLQDESAAHEPKAAAAPKAVFASFTKLSMPALIAVATLVVVLVGAGGFMALGKLHSADAAVSKNNTRTILRLAGSNTIGDSLGPSLAEAFLKEKGATDVRILPGETPLEKVVTGTLPGETVPSSITIAAHGSATAFTALAGKSCDIGMASRKIKPDEEAKLTSLGDMSSASNEHVLGVDGIAVIVNAANPANQLSKDVIKRIFTGEITDWSQAGSHSGPIKIYARDDNSGTYDTFKALVLGGKPLAAGAQRFEDSKALSDAVASDTNAIGFIGLPYILSAKPVAVSEKGTLALLPTRLTVSTEDYLLSRRLYLYTPAAPGNQYTRQFVEFVLSKKGQDVVGANGFIAQNVAQVEQTVAATAPSEYKGLTKEANRLSLDFRFQSGQTELDNKAKDDLDRVVALIADLKISPDRIMLFGFSDSVGSPEINKELSLERAKTIESEFMQRGMNPVVVRGYGSGVAVASDESEEGKAKNRRVEVWVKK